MTRKQATKPRANDNAEDEADAFDGETVFRAAKFKHENLVGDVGDFFLSQMKAARHLPAWETLSEEKQREMIEQARHQALTLVAGVVKGVADRGLPSIPAKVESGSFKMGEGLVTLKVIVAFTPDIAAKLTGGTLDAVVVFASPSAFDGVMESTPDPDQPDMIETPAHDPDTGEITDDEETEPEQPVAASAAR